MKFAERRENGVVIIDLQGKLTLGSGDVQLRQIIRDVLDRGEKAILLNLANVGYMDSAGVGELVLELARRVQRVDVHGDQPGPEYAGEGNGVLQHVR